MFHKHISALFAAFCLVFTTPATESRAASTTFTYQGHLESADVAATGVYDFTFSLYNAATEGDKVGTDVTASAITLTDGLFTAPLDFGPVFDGSQLWLQISLRPAGTSTYTTLTPRQPISQAPQATYASTAGTANSAANGVPSGFSILGNSETPPPGFTWTGRVTGNISESWDHMSDATGSMFNPTMTAHNDSLYVTDHSGRLVAYDILSGIWTELATNSIDSEDVHIASVGDKLYRINNEFGTNQTILTVYTPETDTWATILPPPGHHSTKGLCSLNGLLYVFSSTALHSYNPDTGQWTDMGSLPSSLFIETVGTSDGKIYMFSSNGLAYVYDPAMDGNGSAWTQIASMPTPRQFHSAAYMDGKIYCSGGQTSRAHEIYDIATDTWSPGLSKPGPPVTGSAYGVNGHIYYFGHDQSLHRYTPADPGYYVHVKE